MRGLCAHLTSQALSRNPGGVIWEIQVWCWWSATGGREVAAGLCQLAPSIFIRLRPLLQKLPFLSRHLTLISNWISTVIWYLWISELSSQNFSCSFPDTYGFTSCHPAPDFDFFKFLSNFSQWVRQDTSSSPHPASVMKSWVVRPVISDPRMFIHARIKHLHSLTPKTQNCPRHLSLLLPQETRSVLLVSPIFPPYIISVQKLQIIKIMIPSL